jgi:hypothetical protein
MFDYWLAGRLGQVWLSLHRALRPTLGEMTGECALVARGQRPSAARLHQVQSFAARVWWRAGMITFVLVVPIAVGEVALFPGRAGTDIGVGLVLGATCGAAVAMLQMGMLSFRSGQTRQDMRRLGKCATDEPLPAGSLGLPTRSDFWVVLAIALTAFGILAYAGFH